MGYLNLARGQRQNALKNFRASLEIEPGNEQAVTIGGAFAAQVLQNSRRIGQLRNDRSVRNPLVHRCHPSVQRSGQYATRSTGDRREGASLSGVSRVTPQRIRTNRSAESA
jgi:hypothetical protein